MIPIPRLEDLSDPDHTHPPDPEQISKINQIISSNRSQKVQKLHLDNLKSFKKKKLRSNSLLSIKTNESTHTVMSKYSIQTDFQKPKDVTIQKTQISEKSQSKSIPPNSAIGKSFHNNSVRQRTIPEQKNQLESVSEVY